MAEAGLAQTRTTTVEVVGIVEALVSVMIGKRAAALVERAVVSPMTLLEQAVAVTSAEDTAMAMEAVAVAATAAAAVVAEAARFAMAGRTEIASMEILADSPTRALVAQAEVVAMSADQAMGSTKAEETDNPVSATNFRRAIASMETRADSPTTLKERSSISLNLRPVAVIPLKAIFTAPVSYFNKFQFGFIFCVFRGSIS